MIATKKLALSLLASASMLIASAPQAEAAIIIYKVTVISTAQFFPKAFPLGNSVKSTGYLIYDTITPANSQTVEVFRNKTYQVNGQLLQRIFPSQIGLGAFDKNNDGFDETLNALVAFTSGNATHARSYIGTIPKRGFFIRGTPFIGFSKTLKGKGTVVVSGSDLLTRKETFTIDPLSAAEPNSVAVGVNGVVTLLESKRYNQVP